MKTWLHFGKDFSVLCSFKYHSAFKFCKGQEHSQDKIAAERVFDKADVQNMYLNVTGKQFAYSLYSFNSAAGKVADENLLRLPSKFSPN